MIRWAAQLVVITLLLVTAVGHAAQVGNINATDAIERVAVGADGKLYAWSKEGENVPGWPKSLTSAGRYFAYGPQLIDVDFDLQAEVVVVSAAVGGGDLQLHVFKGNGAELPSWNFHIPQAKLVETPIVADLNHDSSLEIAYATPDNNVFVYRRNFQPIANFTQQLAATPRLVAGDPDNDGLDGLFAAAGGQVFIWNEQGVMSTLFTVPNGAEVIGNIAIADINRDAYPDLVFSTTGDQVVAIDQHGKVLLQIEAPEGAHFASEISVDDIDADKLPELVVATATGEVLAYESSGANVSAWDYQLHFRERLPVSGVVADDRYLGLFTTVTGWDQSYLYRTKHHRYARIVLGENVREWDTFANFDYLETIEIADVFSFPKPFTPNGDGVNDTTLIHYRVGSPALVALDLYDANEHFLSRIQEKTLRAAGEHQEIWNGMNTKGTVTPNDDVPLDTGLYIIKIVAESPEGFVSVAKVGTIINGVKAEIEIPKDNDETDAIYPKVFGIVSISGIATDPNFGENNLDADFQAYKLYYRPGVWTMTDQEIVTVGNAGSGWLPLVVPLQHQCPTNEALEPNDTAYPASNVSCRPVQHGVIGSFDTTDITKTANGEYTLLLKVTDSNGNTIGKVHYDTLVVTVANPNPADPYDPANLYDTNNPDNPIYKGPKITGANLTNASLSLQNPNTVISYALENETANVHIVIYPEVDGAASPVAAIYSFNRLAPNDPGNPKYNFAWNGTNTLGRNVPGGHYRVRITADAVDGTGVDVNESLALDVAKGFAASDTLAVATDSATGNPTFTATPMHFDPIGFGEDLQPEKTYFDYSLTKEAKVTLQVLEDVPGAGLTIRKTLSSGIIKKTDNGNEYWDGSGDNGVILPVGKDYIVRLTAESIDIGNEATITQELTVHLEAATLNGGLPADIAQLKGDDGETATDDGPLTAMTGSPDFLWRAAGTGYVQIPFQYEITAQAQNQYSYFQEGWTGTSAWRPMQVCQYYESCGFLGMDACQGSVAPLTSEQVVDMPKNVVYVAHVSKSDASAYTPKEVAPFSIVPGTGRAINFNQATSQIQADGSFAPGDWFGTTNSHGQFIGVVQLGGCTNPDKLEWQQSKNCMEAYSAVCGDWPCGPDSYGYGVLWTCGNAQLTVTGKTPKTGACTTPPLSTSGSGEVTSAQGQTSAGTYSGSLTSPCLDQNGTDRSASVIPGTTSGATYSLRLQDTVNGVTTPFGAGQQNGYVLVPGLKGWLETASAYVALNPGFPDGTYNTQRDDPYLANAPYKKIWGWYKGFNDDYYHRDTNNISIYQHGYQPNILNSDPGTTLYSFSNVVHLNSWDLDVRYPNISIGKPDGDSLSDIFHVENVTLTPPGVRGTKNSNVEDIFRLRLKPEAVPRRFVDIHGSAGPNYELYYYDNNAATPQWKKIEPRTANPVSNGVLAHWDVTGLNGKQYTVVLKTKNGDQVNVDTMDIGIGTWVDTSGLGPNEFIRVYSTFKRASLIFGPGALSEPRLVTITPVKKDSAAYALPSGIAPLGPIFDIKPDDIVIDPRYHIQLELTFTPAELQEAFGVADASELTIYNLAGNETLEGLATIATYDNMDDSDPANDVWRFTADLEHFSQYFLARKSAGYVHVEAPKPDSYLRDIVDIVARVEALPRTVDQPNAPQPLAALTNLNISYHPTGTPGSNAPIYSETLAQPTTSLADMKVPWNVSGLNGNYTLRIEASGPQGAKASHEIPVAIDNSATKTMLLVNGNAVADGATVSVATGAIVELVATDSASNTWQSGVQAIEYAIDGAAIVPYTQPFAIPYATGAHTINYHGIDKNQNIESDRSAIVVIEEAMSNAAADGVDVQLQINGPQYSSNTQTWVSPDTVFALSAVGGAAKQIKYRVGDAAYVVYDKPFAVTSDAEGSYNLEYFAVDSFGLHAAIHSKLLLLDRSPPGSHFDTVGLAALQGNELVIAPATTVALRAEDLGATPVGLDRIEYKLDDGPWKIYTEPLTFVATTPLAFRAVDRVGNVEPGHVYTVRIDDIGPTLGVIAAPQAISPNGDGRYDTAEIIVRVADNLYSSFTLRMVLQGIDGQEYVAIDDAPLQPGKNILAWDGKVNGEPLPEASYPYTITIIDAGGNASAPYQGTLIYDLTPPATAVLGSAVRSFSPNGDAIFDVLQVDYTVTDNLFAQDLLMKLQILTFAGEDALLTATDSVAIPPEQHTLSWNGTNAAANGVFDGNYRFHLTAEDPAGNRSAPLASEAQSTGEVFVDTVAPVTQLTIDGPTYPANPGTPWMPKVSPEKIWLGPGAEVRLTAADPQPGAGVAAILYGFDEGSMQPYAKPFALPAEDVDYLLHYEAHDVVGNVEVLHRQPVRLDTHSPRSALTIGRPQETDADGRLFISPKTPIDLTAEDGKGVGVKTIWLELVGVKEPSPYEQAFTLDGLGDGDYALKYRSDDFLGNTEAVRQQTLRLDGTAPVTTLVVGDPKYLDPQNGIMYVTSATPIGFEAVADRDDLATTEYRIDDGPWLPAALITLADEGAHLILYRSTDRLGNAEIVKSQKVVVDNSAPIPSLELSQHASGEVDYVTPLTLITLGAVDAGASVAYIEYRIDDGPFVAYSEPFSLGGLSPGPHVITYRVRDRLGNISETGTFAARLVDVAVARQAFQLPRVLVFMLQTRDVRPEDGRPDTELLQGVQEDLGGYMTIIQGDQNDPATVDRFLAEVRSDKYTTFVFATDAYVVEFFDTPKIVNLLRELKSRIYKGDTFISLVGYSQVTGNAWGGFLSGFRPADANYASHFAGLDGLVGARAKRYGRGAIAEFGADLGRLAKVDGSHESAVRSGLVDLIRAIMPHEDRNNAGEVMDYTLTYRNDGDRSVIVRTTEQLPVGWIESKATNGEIAVVLRDFDVTVPAQSVVRVDYLYRSSAGAGEYEIGTTTRAEWADGLRSEGAFTTPYVVEKDLNGLFDELIGPGGVIAHDEMPTVAEKVRMVQRRLLLGANGISTDQHVSLLVGMILDAIEELPVGNPPRQDEVHYILAEIVEGLGTLQTTKALNQDISVGTGDPNDPASYHGDTTSQLSGGDGGCAMVYAVRRGRHAYAVRELWCGSWLFILAGLWLCRAKRTCGAGCAGSGIRSRLPYSCRRAGRR